MDLAVKHSIATLVYQKVTTLLVIDATRCKNWKVFGLPDYRLSLAWLKGGELQET